VLQPASRRPGNPQIKFVPSLKTRVCHY
jgi:hypothetical protein